MKRAGTNHIADTKRTFAGIRSVLFCFFAGLIFSILRAIVAAVSNEHFVQEQQEVREKLTIVPAVSGNGLNAGFISLVNNSGSDIRLRSLTCLVNDMITDTRIEIDGPGQGFTFLFEKEILRKNGDGQSLPCIPKAMIQAQQPAKVVCADIAWQIVYALDDQPSNNQFVNVRYALLPNYNNWVQLSLDAKHIKC